MCEIRISKEAWRILLDMKKRGRKVGAIISELKRRLAALAKDDFRPTRAGLFALRVQDLRFIMRLTKGNICEIIHVGIHPDFL